MKKAKKLPPRLRPATGPERCGACRYYNAMATVERGHCRAYDLGVQSRALCDAFRGREP